MKTHLRIILAGALCFTIAPAYAQFGPTSGGPSGPRLNGSLAKLFGENSSFSASLVTQIKGGASEEPMTMPGKISFAGGKSRFEIDMSQTQGGKMPPQAAAQMKS